MQPPIGSPADTEGLVWSRVDMTWLTPEEMARRTAEREHRHRRRVNSNHFPCPQRHIRDVEPFQYGLGDDRVTVRNSHELRDLLAERDWIVGEPDDRRLDNWRAEVEHEEAVAREIKAAMQYDEAEVAPPEKEDGSLVDTTLAEIVS